MTDTAAVSATSATPARSIEPPCDSDSRPIDRGSCRADHLIEVRNLVPMVDRGLPPRRKWLVLAIACALSAAGGVGITRLVSHEEKRVVARSHWTPERGSIASCVS